MIPLYKKFAAVALVVTAGLTASGCTDPEVARNALDDAGYSDIQIGGYTAYGCSEDDAYHTEFTAKNIRGKSVSGVVCSGVMKGATIRH